jgi:hypothetical protein
VDNLFSLDNFVKHLEKALLEISLLAAGMIYAINRASIKKERSFSDWLLNGL